MNYNTEKWRMKQDQLDDEAIMRNAEDLNLKDLRVGKNFLMITANRCDVSVPKDYYFYVYC